MDTSAALRLARELLDTHGLTGWTVELDNAKTRAGVCRFADRAIGLSAPLTLLHTDAEVRDTILHEVAHALAGPRARHGATWRRIAVSIGCSGQRCVDPSAARIPGAWTGTCPSGHTSTRHQRPTRVVTCAQCSSIFDLRHVLTWTHHGEPALMHPNYAAELDALVAGTPSPLALEVGTRVRVTVPGPYVGSHGTIVRRGRTRFRVRIESGDLLELPFAGVASRTAGWGVGTGGDRGEACLALSGVFRPEAAAAARWRDDDLEDDLEDDLDWGWDDEDAG